MTSVSLCRRHVSDVTIKLNKSHHNNNVITSPFRFDPRGWEPHFVTTEWRPQGALLTQVSRTQRSPRKVFVTKWQSKLTPSYKMVPRFCSTRIRSHPFARFALYKMVGTGGGYTRTILGSPGSNLQQPGQPESRFIFPVLLRSSVCCGVMLHEWPK